MAGVTLDALSKRFPGERTAALEALTLDIVDGEFLVLVGPSGSGKSTALRLIAGLEVPTSGRIVIGLRDVTDVPPQDRDIAMVFQNYALYPHMTVRENLEFGLVMRKTPRADIDRRVARAAETLGLGDLFSRRPGALSGGQRQRVALGRAIVREPAVFLFDEPLSNLDARLRVDTRAELVRLHRALATTMIYVTHDQTEAMTMGQRIAVLDQGRLQQVAAPLELYDHPANVFVAGFIGSPAMNFFRGRVEDGTFRCDEFTIPAGGEAGGVVAGIRPEHVDTGEPADFEAEVQVIEPLGGETIALLRCSSGTRLATRMAGRPDLHPGDRLPLRIRREYLHFFDAASGERR